MAEEKIVFPCASCGQSISVAATAAGKRGRCPKCGEPCVVPHPGGVPGSETVLETKAEKGALEPGVLTQFREADATVRLDESGIPTARVDETDDPLIGQTLDGYRVLEKVGQGGMGRLYLVHDPALDKRFAIKVIAPQLLSQPEALERFQREAKIASRIEDPYVVPVHRFGRQGDHCFFVMSFIQNLEGR